VRHLIEAALDVRIHHPPFPSSRGGEQVDLGNGVMATSPWTEPIARLFTSGFPEGFKRVLTACLQAAIQDGGNSERAEFAGRFRAVHATRGLRAPGLRRGQKIHEASTGLRGLDDHLIHARCVLPRVLLCHSAHAEERVGVAAQQQFLEGVPFA
jgi:hypothetical protein